ncbi:hypothetical protein [Pseudogracilibacillus sp. SO30301A]|uniref:hypothetical protein n=1 Tax=Pseudogracilibacillus sp. SO30301A TaxID=3098291 RepID=UPI00300DEDAB
MDERLYKTIQSIYYSENTIEKVKIFNGAFNHLDNIKVFLFDEKRSNISEEFKNMEVNGYQIFGPTDYTKMWVLDSKHANEHDRVLKISKTLNFDLNILTYLNKYINNLNLNINIPEFVEYLECIKKHKFNYNMSTALMERSSTSLDEDAQKIWGEIIESFLQFADNDFNVSQPVKIRLPENEYKRAQEIFDSLFKLKQQSIIQYQALCCFLLKAFLIKQDKSIKNKTESLLQYSLDNLNVYLELETYLMSLYFESNKAIKKTFEKIEGYSKNTVERILNTAWDIAHVRFMESALEIDNKNKDEIYLSYFSSRDNAFTELERVNPIKMFVVYDHGSFSIREKGITDICTNEVLLDKIQKEAQKRKENISRVNFAEEKQKLETQINRNQDQKFQ